MSVNKVELLGWYGGDITHACSAWTSTSRNLTPEKHERIPKLLKMLATNGHHTPFEKSSLHFLMKVDTVTHYQLLKHRIGVSINTESARYKEMNGDDAWIPEDWPVKWQKALEYHSKLGFDLYHDCLKDLTENHGFSRARAKESARFFKGYNAQLEMDVMFNWRSFMHFQGLRNKPDAQKEIRDLAEDTLRIVRDLDDAPFRFSIEAFGL